MLEKYNETYESEHYIFHFKKNSQASKDILKIVETQENCYKEITQLLKMALSFKINYYLIETREEVGLIYAKLKNDDDSAPCSAFTHHPDTIFCAYNEKIKCIGMHEDTHIISYSIFRPKSAFLREGLAMFMDKVWHGISNEKCVYNLLNSGYDLSLEKLFNNEYFFKINCNISYPIAGAFVNFLVSNYGIDAFLNEIYYSNHSPIKQLNLRFQNEQELTKKFKNFIKTKIHQ